MLRDMPRGVETAHVVYHYDRNYGWHAVNQQRGFLHTDGVWRHTYEPSMWWTGENAYNRLRRAVTDALKVKAAVA